MKRLKSHMIGVDQGSVNLFSDFEDNGKMWSGNGPREHRRKIKFVEQFKSTPTIHVSLDMWDMDKQTNQRADTSTENATARGFDIVFKTWGDTKIARARASWLAIGEVINDDQWDV